MNPWTSSNKTPSIFTDREEPLVSKGTFMRTPAILPLPGLGRMEFLSCLLVRAPPTVFDNNAMAAVLRILWKNHIQKYFILDLLLYLAFFILWVVLVDTIFSGDSSARSGAFKLSVASIVFCLNSLFAVKELIQSDFGRRPGYITSKWNIIDLLCIVCVWWYILSTCFVGWLEDGSEPLAVITSLLVTLVSPAAIISLVRTMIFFFFWLVSPFFFRRS